jgi:hypothetical protein
MPAHANQHRAVLPEMGLEELLVDAFQRGGWKIHGGPHAGERRIDVRVSKGPYRFVVDLKPASEGRRDRLVPLLSQAILQARSRAAQQSHWQPLAVVAAPRIGKAVADALQSFARDHAPDVAVGLLDRQGLRCFVGPGLDQLNVQPKPPGPRMGRGSQSAVHLFSDLNQWMLKVLLAPHIGLRELLSEAIPRRQYRNASDLAKAANVSVMSAFRLVRQLEQEQFLDQSSGLLRLVRLETLLERWQRAYLSPMNEWPFRWILPGNERRQLARALEALGGRACLGLFAAARALGLGHVAGAPAHIYIDALRPERLPDAGLSPSPAGHPASVLLRVPAAQESVFRGAVTADDLLVSDVLQVWLDTGPHPTRGKEQADIIDRHVIRPMIKEANAHKP